MRFGDGRPSSSQRIFLLFLRINPATMSNTSLQAITLHPWVYTLRCAPREGTDCPTLYVGASLDVHRRVTQHFTGRGARFTQTHAPEAVEELHVDVGDTNETVLERERRITLAHMRRYVEQHGNEAWRSVAGAGWSMPHRMAGRPREL